MSLSGLLLASTRVVEPLLRARTPEALLAAVCRIAVDVAGIELAWISLDDSQAHQIHPLVYHGPAAGFLAEVHAVAPAHAAAIRAARHDRTPGFAFASHDLQADARLSWREAATAHGLRAYAAVAILHEGAVIATLHCHAAAAGTFDEDAILALEGLAANAGLALGCLAFDPVEAPHPQDAPAERASSAGSTMGEILTLLMNIIDASSDLVFVKDSSLRVVLCNQAYAQALGTTPEQVHGRTDAENGWLPEPAAGAGAAAHVEDLAVLSGAQVHTPVARVHVGGALRLFDMRKVPLRSERGELIGLVCIAHDITERQHAEQALAESEAHLRRAVEEITRNNMMLDLLTKAQARFIVEMEPQSTFEEMLRILLELTSSDFGFIAQVHRTDHVFLRTLAVTNLAWNEETQSIYEASAQSGIEFHNMDNLFGAVVKTGEMVVANDPPNDPRRGYTPEGHPPINAFLGLPFKQGGKLLGMVGIANRPDGYDEAIIRYLDPFLATSASMVFAHGNEIRRHAVEEELRALNAELEQRVAARTAELQQTNQELEAFTYSVSHDLKAPLRSIDSFSAILLAEHTARLDPNGRQLLERVRRAAQRMSMLIDDLLAYSKLERYKFAKASVSLHALIAELLAEHSQEIAERKVTVQVDLPWDSLDTDREGLAMAVRNLVENALKFTRGVEHPRIEIGGRTEAQARVLWVRDNGCGFEMHQHDRIFEIFQRLHRVDEYPGTGVGLALVRKAMQRMDGHAWAESRPGEGAVFYLSLPHRAS